MEKIACAKAEKQGKFGVTRAQSELESYGHI